MLAHCPAGVAAMAVLPLPFVGPRITAPVFGYCMGLPPLRHELHWSNFNWSETVL